MCNLNWQAYPCSCSHTCPPLPLRPHLPSCPPPPTLAFAQNIQKVITQTVAHAQCLPQHVDSMFSIERGVCIQVVGFMLLQVRPRFSLGAVADVWGGACTGPRGRGGYRWAAGMQGLLSISCHFQIPSSSNILLLPLLLHPCFPTFLFPCPQTASVNCLRRLAFVCTGQGVAVHPDLLPRNPGEWLLCVERHAPCLASCQGSLTSERPIALAPWCVQQLQLIVGSDLQLVHARNCL